MAYRRRAETTPFEGWGLFLATSGDFYLAIDNAYAAHPERFVRKHPEPPKLPTAVWINPPKETPSSQ